MNRYDLWTIGKGMNFDDLCREPAWTIVTLELDGNAPELKKHVLRWPENYV